MSPSDEPHFIDVCAAVIERDGTFLLALRPTGTHLHGHWEFPGGKVHAGESLKACICREIQEELSLPVSSAEPLHTVEHHYPEKSIRLHFLTCAIPASACPHPLEHEDIGWFTLDEASTLELAPADRSFLIWWAATGAGGVP